MAFDIRKFLTEDLQLTAEQLAVVEPVLAPKATVLESGYLRQQDYSAKMNEVGTLQQQLAAKDAQLTAEATEWAQLSASEKQQATDLRASLNRTQQEALALKQRIELIATEAGLDPAKALEGLTVTPTKTTATTDTPPPFDPSKFVSVEQYQGAVAMALNLPAELMAIADEHFALTGERLDTRKIVAEIDARAKTPRNQKALDPRSVWEEQHGIGAKREAKTKAEYDAAIQAAEERGALAARTEMATPTPGAPGRHSVVLTRAVPAQSALKRSQPGEAHNTAVAAFTSGKYRTGAPAKS